MKKMNLLLAAVFAGLGVRAQAVGVQPAVKPVNAGKSWSRVNVKLGKVPNKSAAIKVAWDLPKPPKPRPLPPTCGVRG